MSTEDIRLQELSGMRNKVIELIREVYCAEIVAPLKVTPLCPIGWLVSLGFPAPEKPVTISAELPDDEFLEYLKKELQFAAWNARESYTINLITNPWKRTNLKKS